MAFCEVTRELEQLAPIIQSASMCLDCPSLKSILGHSAALIGAEQCLALLVQGSESCVVSRSMAINHTFHEEWLRLYQEREFGKIDPILRSSFADNGLIEWNSTYREIPPPRGFQSLAEDFGLFDGLTHGLAEPGSGCRSVISFGSRKAFYGAKEKMIIEVLIGPIHRALIRLLSPKPVEVPHLTVRERDILRWSAEGKTCWEIGNIMSISERTVKFHIRSLLSKLKATNRSQVIARAIELDMI